MTNITKAAQDALEALDALLDVAMVPMTYETLATTDSAARWDDFSARRDRLRAALQDKAGEVPADGWLQDGGLLCRLTDERRPQNRDEINVTMADGSRSPESRARRAGELLDRIRSAQPAPVVPDGFALVPVEPTEAMIQAGIDEMPHFTDEPGPVWSAMIAAAQQKEWSAG